MKAAIEGTAKLEYSTPYQTPDSIWVWNSNARNTASSIISTLKSYRTDTKFHEFWSATEHAASELDLEPPHVPRRRKVPKRIDEGTSDGEFPDSPEAVHRPIQCSPQEKGKACRLSMRAQSAYANF